ncbi:MAG: type I DNA topoisomerase [bacterium]|nr:type I DNA topoisomerase [bacterium]
MEKSLVIVESDAKSKTIKKFLGEHFAVKASVGHIKNLPKNRLGVDLTNGFEPEFITIRGRGKILQELKKLAQNSDRVFIATDPDREGEAIAAHLAEEIEPSNSRIQRVLFHEITEKAVREAIGNPLTIDADKVEAQKARRVMDRLVGYQVSPFLWKTIYRGLSAGRVQTVALRLLCEREEQISKFTPREYWTIEAEFRTRGQETFKAKLMKIAGEDADLPDEAGVRRHSEILRGLSFAVSDLKTRELERNPYPPYTTSTLQQDAVRRLSMTTKQIMAVAQQLYEGVDLPEGRVGLISYMRTDSTRLSADAVEEARQAIAEGYGLEYVPARPRQFSNKKSAQDAHEAIRPTSLKRPPQKIAQYLTPQQKKLYELIWNRFLACQMAPAKFRQTILEVTGGDYLFRTIGTDVVFKGFMQIYEVEEKEAGERNAVPPGVRKSDAVSLQDLDPEQHFTKPPARFNESSLVKELDSLGIGRPSTYALIISILLDRKYAERQARTLVPTQLGVTVNGILVRQFPDIFNVGFTAQMEEELDQIESGEKKRPDVLRDFYRPFNEAVTRAMDKKEEIRESLQQEHDEKCPKCGKDLVVKWGRNGRFIACTGYPDCKFTKPLKEDMVETKETCEKCGSPMVVKTGRFGRFLACSRYPDCKSTKPLSTGVPCPAEGCTGTLVEKRSGRGKMFFGCSRYPDCKFATWNRPLAQKCEKCGFPVLEQKISKKKGEYLQCPQCKATSGEEQAETGAASGS